MHGLHGRIGIALGSGAARGWAHIGVLRALEEAGLTPQVVCGSSSGALVGAVHAAGRMEAFEAWGRKLDRRAVMSFLDVSLRGGLIKARKILETIGADLSDRRIETLPHAFACVATDLESGREVWLREGPLLESLRASMAVPGLVRPVRIEGRWLVDGGLVNAVPVSLCRAMGADSVIAVDLDTMLLRRRFTNAPGGGAPLRPDESWPDEAGAAPAPDAPERSEPGGVRAQLLQLASDVRDRVGIGEPDGDVPPSIFEVMANAINIMQVRITRSRMAGDPPDLLVAPRLADFALLDFDRAGEAIEEGRRAVARALAPGAEGATA